MKINELFYLPTGEWADLTDYQIEEIVRMVRNRLLQECDWTQLPDSPLADTKRSEWTTYRQALRDITETYAENLLDTEFPNQPEL
jgi:hypothetical protein